MARRLLRSTSSENADCRSFSGRSENSWAEVGRVLLVQQIDEVRRRAHSEQTLDGVENDVEFALGHGAVARPDRGRANCSI